MPTKIYFVRHGESTENPKGKFYDSPEAILTEKGRVQAKEVGEKLRKLEIGHIDVVYCSPWERARETCEIVLKVSGISYHATVFDKRLRERSFAGIVGKLINDTGENDASEEAVSRQEYQEIWTYGSPTHERLGIETLYSLEERVGDFLDDISRWHSDGAVLIVAHGGLGRMMQALCEGWPEEGKFNSIKFLDNGEIAEWEYKEG